MLNLVDYEHSVWETTGTFCDSDSDSAYKKSLTQKKIVVYLLSHFMTMTLTVTVLGSKSTFCDSYNDNDSHGKQKVGLEAVTMTVTVMGSSKFTW